jgi:hypothetical protein
VRARDPGPVFLERRLATWVRRECDDVHVLALTMLGFLGWLGMLLLAIALVVGLVVLVAHAGGDIDIDP